MRTLPRELPDRPVPSPSIPASPRRPARRLPLPDAEAVRRYWPPASAPPYDGEAAADDQPGPESAGPASRSSLSPKRETPLSARRGPGAPGGPADDAGWAGQFAQALAEALAGSRPAAQVTPWTTEQARQRIRQLGPLLQAGPRPRVRRVRTSAPDPDVVEMTVVIGIGPRVRAMAVRLERNAPNSRERQWLCTAIEAA